MEFAAVNSPAAAFVAGLVTSLHCAGMCGPLACSLMPVRGECGDAQTVSTVYHLTRLTSYAILGALAGGLGSLPLTWMSHSILRWLPWVTVIFFVALALRWERHIPKWVVLGRLAFRLQSWLRGRSRTQAAAALGLATPVLPCGPLYFLIALAMLSGSALRGVEFMLAFGLGTTLEEIERRVIRVHAGVRPRNRAAALARAIAISMGALHAFAALARPHAMGAGAHDGGGDRLAAARHAGFRRTRSGLANLFLR